MCGIVGVAGTLEKKHVEAFNNMLIFDQVRGSDSTGAAAVTRRNACNLLKQLGPPNELMYDKRYDSLIATSGNKMLLGHNRYKTVGDVTKSNAHPFEFEGVVGVHNGTLDWDARRKLTDHDKFGTDSEALYYNLDEAQGDITKVIPKLKGAWSLVWYCWWNEKINFLRNKERPMFFAFTKDRKVLLWASEAWMVEVSAQRNKIELDKMFFTAEDTWYTLSIPGYNEEFGVFTRKKVEGDTSPRSTTTTDYQGGTLVRYTGAAAYGGQTQNTGSNVAAGPAPQRTSVVVTPEAGSNVVTLERKGGSQQATLPFKPGELGEKARKAGVYMPPLSANSVNSNVKPANEPEKKGPVSRVSEARLFTEGLEDNPSPPWSETKLAMKKYFKGTLYRDYNGFAINEEEFEKRTAKHECANCSASVSWGEDVLFLPNSKTEFLCEECIDDTELMQYIVGVA